MRQKEGDIIKLMKYVRRFLDGKDYNNALTFLKAAQSRITKNTNKSIIYNIHVSLGKIYQDKKEHKLAIENYQKAEEFSYFSPQATIYCRRKIVEINSITAKEKKLNKEDKNFNKKSIKLQHSKISGIDDELEEYARYFEKLEKVFSSIKNDVNMKRIVSKENKKNKGRGDQDLRNTLVNKAVKKVKLYRSDVLDVIEVDQDKFDNLVKIFSESKVGKRLPVPVMPNPIFNGALDSSSSNPESSKKFNDVYPDTTSNFLNDSESESNKYNVPLKMGFGIKPPASVKYKKVVKKNLSGDINILGR